MKSWFTVDDMWDAFDCDTCDAMVQYPYRVCPKCGDKKEFVEDFTIIEFLEMRNERDALMKSLQEKLGGDIFTKDEFCDRYDQGYISSYDGFG